MPVIDELKEKEDVVGGVEDTTKYCTFRVGVEGEKVMPVPTEVKTKPCPIAGAVGIVDVVNVVVAEPEPIAGRFEKIESAFAAMLTSSKNRGAAWVDSAVVPSPTRSATSEDAVKDGNAVTDVACTVNLTAAVVPAPLALNCTKRTLPVVLPVVHVAPAVHDVIAGVHAMLGMAVRLVTSQKESLMAPATTAEKDANETLLPTGATTLRLHHELAVAVILYEAGMTTVTSALPTAIWLTAAPKTVLHMGYPAEKASARAVKYTPSAAVLSVPSWRYEKVIDAPDEMISNGAAPSCVTDDCVATENRDADWDVVSPSRTEKDAAPSDCVPASVGKELVDAPSVEAPKPDEIAASGTDAEPMVARTTKPGGAVTVSLQSCTVFVAEPVKGADEVVAYRGSEEPMRAIVNEACVETVPVENVIAVPPAVALKAKAVVVGTGVART